MILSRGGEKVLEAIQAAWIEEATDSAPYAVRQYPRTRV